MALSNVELNIIFQAVRFNFIDSKEEKIIREMLTLAFLTATDTAAAIAQLRGYVLAFQSDHDATIAGRTAIRAAENATDTANQTAITNLLAKAELGGP